MRRQYVIRILDACGFNAIIGISVLIEKSLLTTSKDDLLLMHDLLQEMGRRRIKKESPEIGERSRLWDEEDVRRVLIENRGTNRVEAIILEKELNLSIAANVFSKMINLRMLKIRKVQLREGLEYLSSELRLLDWDGYSLKSLPSNLQLNKLVEFRMQHSRIQRITPWNSLISMCFKDCNCLTKTPDFTGIPNLKELTLERCSRLSKIHPSLLVHKNIKKMNLSCLNLRNLPSEIHMESLERLSLNGCSRLKNFPEITGSMERLYGLNLIETAIEELPLSIALLTRLTCLRLEGCKNLLSLPTTINGLKSLVTLCISRCSKLVNLPSTMNGLESLRTLNLTGCTKLENAVETLARVDSLRRLNLDRTSRRRPMPSTFTMKNLENFNFRGCGGLSLKSFLDKSSNPLASTLPSLSGDLRSLFYLDLSYSNIGGAIPNEFFGILISLKRLDLSGNSFVSLPTTINRLSNLTDLSLKYCTNLQILPELPSNIERLLLDGCVSLETLPNALRLGLNPWSKISCQNCLKLLNGSRVAFSILKEHLKAGHDPFFSSHVAVDLWGEEIPFDRLKAVVPGCEFPEWLKYKNESGSFMKMEKPNNSKLVGYIFCCAFIVASTDEYFAAKIEFTSHSSGIIWSENLLIDCKAGFSNEYPLDHLWVWYLSSSNLTKLEDPATFSIESEWIRGRIKVKKCGFHPVYEHEDYNELIEDFVGSTTDVESKAKN